MVIVEGQVFTPEKVKVESNKCAFCQDYARLSAELIEGHVLRGFIGEEYRIGDKVVVTRASIPRRIKYCLYCGRRLDKEKDNEQNLKRAKATP